MIVTVTGTVAKRCPTCTLTDLGTATLTFTTDTDAPDPHTLRALLRRDEPLTHEQITRSLLDEPGCVRVVTTWPAMLGHPVEVTCEAKRYPPTTTGPQNGAQSND